MAQRGQGSEAVWLRGQPGKATSPPMGMGVCWGLSPRTVPDTLPQPGCKKPTQRGSMGPWSPDMPANRGPGPTHPNFLACSLQASVRKWLFLAAKF